MHNRLRLGATMFLAACLMGMPPPSSFALDAPNAASASLSEALQALQKEQYAVAIHICDQLLKKDPRAYKAWTLRAIGLERSQQTKQALASYREALKLSPDYLPALEGEGQLEYHAQSPQAVPLLRHILALQPANATAHAMLGVLEYRQNDFQKAALDFAAAGKALDAQPDARMAYAICLDRLDRKPEAIALLRQLLVLQPMNATARYDLALVQWQSGSKEEALITLKPLLDVPGADSRIARLAAAIHEAANETPQAVELLRMAIKANPDEPANYLDFAVLAFKHGSSDVGVDIVSRGLTRIPNSAALHMARGVLYGQNGDFDQAMADFDQAHTLDPSFSMAATAEGIAQSQRHNHDAALADFRRQVREHPNDALGYYLLAESLSWSSPDAKQEGASAHFEEAILMATKSVALDASLVQAWDLLGSLYLQTDKPDQAIQACRTALKLKPKDQQALYTLILALRKTGSREELKSLVQQLMNLREQEQIEKNQTMRYGRLVEEPSAGGELR